MFDQWVPDEVETPPRAAGPAVVQRLAGLARGLGDAARNQLRAWIPGRASDDGWSLDRELSGAFAARPAHRLSIRAYRYTHDHWAHITAGLCAVLVVWAACLQPARAQGDRVDALIRLLRLTGGDLGDKGMARLAGIDPSAALIAGQVARLPPAPVFNGPDPAGTDAAQSPPTLELPGMTPDQARLINASIPVSSLPNPAARPFFLPPANLLDATRAVDCLTAAVYYESAGQPLAGQQAVAQVVLNRMRHPAFPKSVCGVVFQGSNRPTGCQFTFTCDGSLMRKPSEGGWMRAREVAVAALNGYVMRDVGNATHYHADYVAPYWSTSLVKVATIGAHIFYRWTGGWGEPRSFAGAYTGEPLLQLAGLGSVNPGLTVALPFQAGVNVTAPGASTEVLTAPGAGEPAPAAAATEAPKIDLVVSAPVLAPLTREAPKPAPKKEPPPRGEWNRLPTVHSF